MKASEIVKSCISNCSTPDKMVGHIEGLLKYHGRGKSEQEIDTIRKATINKLKKRDINIKEKKRNSEMDTFIKELESRG